MRFIPFIQSPFLKLALLGKRYYTSVTPLLHGLGPDGVTPILDYLNQMITGLLLSDASLVKKYEGGGTYFQFAQSVIHTSYIFFVHKLFFLVGYCHMIKPTVKTATVKGKKYNYLSFTTKSLPD
jgi:hypothetical protein